MSGVRDFWDKNWQWILGVFGILLSWIISGIIGFYAAVIAIEADITSLIDRVSKAETEISSVLKPKLNTIADLEKRLLTLEGDFKYVKKESELVKKDSMSILKDFEEIDYAD